MSIVINDVAPRVHYIATAGQTVFIIPFEFLQAADIKIWINGVLHYFVEPPTENWMYSLTGIGVSGGGSATFGSPGRYAGDKVVIIRDMPIARAADLPTHGVFPVESLNEHFDALTAMVQQTEVNVQNRSLTLTDHDEPVVLNDLPLQAVRANKMLSFDGTGQPVAEISLQDILTAVSDAEAAADEAQGWAEASQQIIIADAAPAPLLYGKLWWDSNGGQLYVSYDDGTSTQWVQIIGSKGDPGPDGADGVPGPAGPASPSYLRWACSDETSAIMVGDAKLTDRMPYAFTATGLKASLNVAQAAGSIFTVDMKWWNGSAFVSILSTLLTFDNTETSSLTAVQPVLSKTSFADDDIVRIDVTQVGDGTAKGLKVTLLGQKT